MGNGRGRGRGGRGGRGPRGNRGSYRGGGYQGGGSNEYSSMGNEYQPFASNSYYIPRDDGFFESGNSGFHSFRGSQGAPYTLADEARDTGRHMGGLGSTGALRHSAVKFVPSSTGNLDLADLLKPLNLVVQPEKQEENASEGGVEKDISPDLEPSNTRTGMEKPQEDLSQTVKLSGLDLNDTETHIRTEKDSATGATSGAPVFVIDLVGDPSLLPKKEVPDRAASPTPSASSSEEIVFVPRRHRGDTAQKAVARATSRPTGRQQLKKQAIHTKTSETAAQLAPGGEPNILADSTVGVRFEVVIDSTHKPATCHEEVPNEVGGPAGESPAVENKWAGRLRKRKGAGRRKKDDDDEALRDYEENILAQFHAGEAGESSDAMRSRNRPIKNDWFDTTDDEAEKSPSSDSSYREDDEDLKLARLLQRREELGIVGGSDLDSLDAEIMELDADFFPLGAGKRKKKKTKRRGGGNDIDSEDFVPDPSTGHFPSASWTADAYEGFDVMEWDRPSLAKRKGKGKQPAFGLSDSEQEEELQASWAKDREKKKIRKQERKARRAEGMLGNKARKTGKRDPNAKFPEGITMEQLKQEIQAFLENDIQCLTLPPMDKKNRKTVHHIAMAFNLKSKSFGSGKTRFPTLIKTSSSAIYEEDSTKVAQIMRTEAFLARPDIGSGRRGVGKRGAGRGGGAGRARGEWGGAGSVVRHKEGDIVGAGAAELAEDNRGRIMLEKMGYRAGMALGADSNKGIIVPLAAVMKVGKAGLG
ncbi:hypothetical protein B9Z19DRAFT_1091536 [Tuber borchii]|uniref:Protein SQS1 n=1 Tax=Tuber borchii TaxID=42251 RepID=A0A2T6ZHF1_TUBBO|nr:hypothetical protein B9Z19DRAFT_1091536 [Tuber borchii]